MKTFRLFIFIFLTFPGGIFAQELGIDTTIFKVAEEMPRFPGCEHLDTTMAAKTQCSQASLLSFMYGNIRYPLEARQNGNEGTVVIGFVVEKDGNKYAFTSEYPELPIATKPDTGNGGGNGGGSDDNTTPDGKTCEGVNVNNINTYPNWPRTNWAGQPSHAVGGDLLIHNGAVYKAKWWTNGAPSDGGAWQKVCSL